MELIAHRGLHNKDIKENTIEAFLNAINNNYDGIELDIRYTKDKEIVVLHDSFINRTSNGTGKLKDYNYKDLKKYNFGSKKIKSKIPRLIDVIKKINNTIIFIELKENIDSDDLDSILKLNTTNTYYIFSFNKKYIENINESKRGLVNYVFNSGIDITYYDFILILEDFINEKIIDYLKNNNIEPVIYNTRGNINLKNKEFLANLKYIV